MPYENTPACGPDMCSGTCLCENIFTKNDISSCKGLEPKETFYRLSQTTLGSDASCTNIPSSNKNCHCCAKEISIYNSFNGTNIKTFSGSTLDIPENKVCRVSNAYSECSAYSSDAYGPFFTMCNYPLLNALIFFDFQGYTADFTSKNYPLLSSINLVNSDTRTSGQPPYRKINLTTLSINIPNSWKLSTNTTNTCSEKSICFNPNHITSFELNKYSPTSLTIDFEEYSSLYETTSTLTLNSNINVLTLSPNISTQSVSTIVNAKNLKELTLDKGFTKFTANIGQTIIETLDLSSCQLSEFQPISLPSTLKSLTLQNTTTELTDKPQFINITSISFADNFNIINKTLTPFTGLTSVNLKSSVTDFAIKLFNTIKSIDIKIPAKPMLATINLSGTSITSFSTNLSTASSLKTLTLPITLATFDATLPSELLSLDLQDTVILKFPNDFSKVTKLETLKLPKKLTSYSATLGAEVKSLSLPTLLQTIDLTGTTITQLTSTDFTTYIALSSLTLGAKEIQYNFTLNPTTFKTNGLNISPSASTLHTIDLSGTAIAQLKTGADFSSFGALQSLVLGPDVVAL